MLHSLKQSSNLCGLLHINQVHPEAEAITIGIHDSWQQMVRSVSSFNLHEHGL